MFGIIALQARGGGLCCTCGVFWGGGWDDWGGWSASVVGVYMRIG